MALVKVQKIEINPSFIFVYEETEGEAGSNTSRKMNSYFPHAPWVTPESSVLINSKQTSHNRFQEVLSTFFKGCEGVWARANGIQALVSRSKDKTTAMHLEVCPVMNVPEDQLPHLPHLASQTVVFPLGPWIKVSKGERADGVKSGP